MLVLSLSTSDCPLIEQPRRSCRASKILDSYYSAKDYNW